MEASFAARSPVTLPGLHGPGAGVCPREGRPLRASFLRALLPRLARKAGIEKRVHPHGLRHTCAAELAIEGCARAAHSAAAGPCQPAHHHGQSAPQRPCGAGRADAPAELDFVKATPLSLATIA